MFGLMDIQSHGEYYYIKDHYMGFCPIHFNTVTSLIHWLVYANYVIIHLDSVSENPSIFTSTSMNNCSLYQ